MVVIGTHHYKGLIDFCYLFYEDKSVGSDFFNNGNRSCLLFAVKALCALN